MLLDAYGAFALSLRAYDLAFLGVFCNKRALAITMLHSFPEIMGGFPTDILSPFQPICPPGDTRSCVTCPDVQDWPGLEQEMCPVGPLSRR